MKYKAGDKVVVRNDLQCGQFYYNENRDGCDVATIFMIELCGKVVTIKRVVGDKYHIKEDGDKFSWTDDMFVPVSAKMG